MKVRTVISVLAPVLVALASQAALAASGGHGGHGEPHINWWAWDTHAPPIGWFLIDFIIFIALLVRFVGRPLSKSFQKRHDTIKSSIAENEAALAKAKAAFDEARGKLGAVEDDTRTLIAKIKEDGANERERIIQSARTYAERLKKDTEQLVKNEANAARERLRRTVAEQALALAEQQLVQSLTAADKDRMVDSAIEELEAGEHVPAGSKRRQAVSQNETGGVQ